MSLDRPIFLVGHARSGSTALAAILAQHPDIGPKPKTPPEIHSSVLSQTRNCRLHLHYSEQLEQKDIWFSYFGGEQVFTHMGLPLVRTEEFATKISRKNLISDLTRHFDQPRFLSKAPTNTFRMRALACLFPDAKFLVLYRDGPSVVASWGQRPYGFGRKVNWGEIKTRRLSYYQGINVFSRKWMETLAYAESCASDLQVLRITYSQLVTSTASVLRRIEQFLELREPLVCPDGLHSKGGSAWRGKIPAIWQPYLLLRTNSGGRVLRQIEQES